jgi:hypothetical protein
MGGIYKFFVCWEGVLVGGVAKGKVERGEGLVFSVRYVQGIWVREKDFR